MMIVYEGCCWMSDRDGEAEGESPGHGLRLPDAEQVPEQRGVGAEPAQTTRLAAAWVFTKSNKAN